jgi:hypothetical protein
MTELYCESSIVSVAILDARMILPGAPVGSAPGQAKQKLSQTVEFNSNTVLFLRRRESGGTSSFFLELVSSAPGQCLPIPEACCCSEGRRDDFPMHVHQPAFEAVWRRNPKALSRRFFLPALLFIHSYPKPEQLEEEDFAMARVLCTGVDPLLMKTRQLILESAGHTVVPASDEREIKAVCSKQKFEVAVI